MIRKGIVPMKIAIVTGASSGLGSEFVRQIRKQEKYIFLTGNQRENWEISGCLWKFPYLCRYCLGK